MNRILLTTVALVALGSTSAFAGTNFALIAQGSFLYNAHQNANIDQTHANYSSAVVSQLGGYQNANIDQGDRYRPVWGDHAAIVQVGFGQQAYIDQDSSHNTAVIVQVGAGQNASIHQ